MPLYYITGVSGTGKSSILNELKKRGHEAHGVDEDVYAKWIHRQSGEAVDFPGEDMFEIHEWYKNHRWVIDAGKVTQLRQHADTTQRNVYLCDSGAEDKAVWHHFAKVFALSIDIDTLKHRLAQRTTNDFGKTPEELQEVLEWHNGYDDRHRQRGSVLIDATQPVEVVVNQILAQSS